MPATAADLVRETSAGATAGRVAGPTFALVSISGNLGNAATQDAVIASIRKRFSDATIYGITSNPADTIERHGLRSFPIAGFSVGTFGVTPMQDERLPADERHLRGVDSLPHRVATALRSLLMRVARWALPRAWPYMIRTEITHILGVFRFLKDVDILLIPGGGQLIDTWGGPWGHPYALLKLTVLARLRRAKPIFLCVGYSGLDSRLGRLFTRAALSLATYRSYRDTGSRELMGRAGFRRDDPVYPDLAYSYPLNGPFLPRDRGPRRVVGLSPFCYCHPRFWNRGDAGAYQAYVQHLAAIARWLVDKEYRLSMFASGVNDRCAIDDLCELLSEQAGPRVTQCIERHDVTTVPGFLEHAAAVDLMVASRLHGVLLSQLVGTPVIALSWDRKVNVQMEAVGQSPYCLNVDRLQLSDFQECFNRLEANADAARQQIHARCADHRAHLEVQYDAILVPESRS